ncbi:RNA-binding protein 34 isoform X2 [Plodia interpunctella]|uniref:RNA-binding protein 34 isoform X2 n=1 Tax=Plodia interpunctella TaxID=58824 RepID=UPI002367DBEB|nr:RNA-binding protein 34 isoform X2 [Plodia interpunctella]
MCRPCILLQVKDFSNCFEMDYVVGSVAALISGNVTPNRPKLVRRALTPMKHQPSPNVTPKSEFVEDRSIFLSPTLQKKKAIVKKSPKRIFENPDLDVASENEGNDSPSSPKADKVKKHLQEELLDNSKGSPISPKNKKNISLDMSGDNSDSVEGATPKKKKNKSSVSDRVDDTQNNETPKKKNSKVTAGTENISENLETNVSPKKSKKKLSVQIQQNIEEAESESPKKKNKKRKHSENTETENGSGNTVDTTVEVNKKKKKKNKKQNKNLESAEENVSQKENSKKLKQKMQVNPNAITEQDTDSEHESDNEIESENDEANKEILDTGPAQDSSDEEEEAAPKKPEKVETPEASEDEVRRTLFVGNVPFTKKCKKEIKKIFSKYGTIETVRIRTVPIKDPRFTPKLALIKNELHPERSTVNVYVKFKEESSVEQALAENNTVLNDHHLRVTRSDSAGATHDRACAVFVGNLPFALEDERLRDKFAACGEIHSVRIIRDKKTNAGKGFGYINFASKDGVELALNMKDADLTIKNRILRVKRCVQTKPGSNPGPKGHNQGGHNQGRRRWTSRQEDEALEPTTE